MEAYEIPQTSENSQQINPHLIQCGFINTTSQQKLSQSPLSTLSSDSSMNQHVFFPGHIEKETRDVGCQCEPEVRHFAVQIYAPEKIMPEVAEVGIQVSPDMSSTSSQCPVRLKHFAHQIKSTNIVTQVDTGVTPNKYTSLISPPQPEKTFQRTSSSTIPDVQGISPSADDRSFHKPSTTVEETSSNIGLIPVTHQKTISTIEHHCDLPNQQNPVSYCNNDLMVSATTPMHDTVPLLQTFPNVSSHNPAWSQPDALVSKEVFKEMFFVVDATNLNSQMVANQQLIVVDSGQQLDVCDEQLGIADSDSNITVKAPSFVTTNKPVNQKKRKRNRKSGENKQEAENLVVCSMFDKKLVYSRSLFPTDSTEHQEFSDSPPPAKAKRRILTPITTDKLPPDKLSALPVKHIITASPSIGNDNVNLNESNVSTVYEPLPTSRPTSATDSLPTTKDATATNINKTSLKRVCSLSKEEKSINDSFISKYWK